MSWELSTSEGMCHRTKNKLGDLAVRTLCRRRGERYHSTLSTCVYPWIIYLSWPNRKFLHDLTAISLIIFDAHLAQCIEVQASAFQDSQGEMESLLHLSQGKQLNQGFHSRRLHIEVETLLNWPLSSLAQVWGCSNASSTSQRSTTKWRWTLIYGCAIHLAMKRLSIIQVKTDATWQWSSAEAMYFRIQ